MLLSAVSVLVVAQSSSEIPEGLMNNPVYTYMYMYVSVMYKLIHPESPFSQEQKRTATAVIFITAAKEKTNSAPR